MRHQLRMYFYCDGKNRNYSIFPIGLECIMRQTQLEKCYFFQSSIIVVTVEALLTKDKWSRRWEDAK